MNRLVDQLGAGPFFLIEGVPLENVLGAVSRRSSLTIPPLAHCGDGPIELMEILSLGPERVEQGFSASRPGIHTSPTPCRQRTWPICEARWTSEV